MWTSYYYRNMPNTWYCNFLVHDSLLYKLIYGIYIDTWYVIFDTWSTALDIRHRYLICHTWHLILIPDIWHAFMWYKYIDLTSWPLTGHYHPWYMYYMAYSWLSLLRGLGMIIILLPDIWYSWTPVLLNSCILEPLKKGTPDTILLLIPVIG